jgi:hypothetical protein
VALALVAFASAVGAGAATPAETVADQVELLAALEALQIGEPELALELLERLEAGATTEAGRVAYQAFAAYAEGEWARAVGAAERALALTSSGPSELGWLREELVRLAARLRLRELRERSTERLTRVLERHYEARGGLERLLAIDRLVASGIIRAAGEERPLRLYRKRPRLYRLEVGGSEVTEVTVSNGRASWKGAAGPEGMWPLEGAARSRLARESWFDDVLLRYRDSGERLYAPPDQSRAEEGELRIEVTAPDGTRQTIFLSGETLLELRRVVREPSAQAPTMISFEHRQVGGLWLPARQVVESPAGRVEVLLESYLFDEPLPNGLFEPSPG